MEDSALNTTQVTEAEAVRKPGSKKRSVSVPVARQNVSNEIIGDRFFMLIKCLK